jgi:hypothetical protein
MACTLCSPVITHYSLGQNLNMGAAIRYLNTDLDLTSAVDLTGLTSALEALGVRPLHVTQSEDGLWRSILETATQYLEPALNIAAIVAAIELLDEANRAAWLGCTQRDFNVGYDCGALPLSINLGISPELLGRVAAIGGSLQITLYPDPALGVKLSSV